MIQSQLFPIGQMTKFICFRFMAASFEALLKAHRFFQKYFIKFLFWGRKKYIGGTICFPLRGKKIRTTISQNTPGFLRKSSRSKDDMRCQHNQHVNNSTIIDRREFTGCHPKWKGSQTRGPVMWSVRSATPVFIIVAHGWMFSLRCIYPAVVLPTWR